MPLNILVPVGLILLGVLFIISAILKTWKKIPIMRAAVRTGVGKRKVVFGGGMIVIPVLQRMDIISLENVDVPVGLKGTMTKEGVKINLDGNVVAKIRNIDADILSAMEQFHCGNPEETREKIISTTRSSLEGRLREIIATLTVEQINLQREQFIEAVMKVAVPQLEAYGLELKSFTINDITDDAGYMDALGAKRIAEVTRDAEIGKAEAIRETNVKTAEAYRIGESAKLVASAQVSEAQKDNDVKVLEFDQERKRTAAATDNAYKIQEAKISQEVINAEMDAAVIREKRSKEVAEAAKDVEIAQEKKGIELAQTKADRKERELLETVVKPADAQRQAVELEAEAEKIRKVKAAEADAETIKLNGDAEAERIRKIGEAEAKNIELKAIAEAEGMKQKAEAFNEYGPAAIIDIIFKNLPEMAKAIAEPMSRIEKINIIGGGGSDGSGGAVDVARWGAGTMQAVIESVGDSCGIDLKEMIRAHTFEGKTTKNINLDLKGANLTELAKAMATVVDGQSVEETPAADTVKAETKPEEPIETEPVSDNKASDFEEEKAVEENEVVEAPKPEDDTTKKDPRKRRN